MSNIEPKYKTLAELNQAYRQGEVTEALMLDNDDASVWIGEDSEDDLAGTVQLAYESHPTQLLEDALDLLGIPWDHV